MASLTHKHAPVLHQLLAVQESKATEEVSDLPLATLGKEKQGGELFWGTPLTQARWGCIQSPATRRGGQIHSPPGAGHVTESEDS